MQTSDNEYLKLTRDLVSMPSVSSNTAALQQAIDYCEEYFSHYPFLKTKKIMRNGKPLLITGTNTDSNPKVAILGHLDVVPAPAELFATRQEGSLLYGRGVCDMKGSVAIAMDVLCRVAKTNPSLSCELWLTTDEELAGTDGVRYIVEELKYRPSIVLVPDGGSAPETVVLKGKGLLPLEMQAKGTEAHASRPWEGKSAILKLIAAYQQLEKLFPNSSSTAHADTATAYHWYSTAVMTTIQGGEASNVVPGDAKCLIDIRLAEDVDIATIKSELDNISQSTDVSINILDESPVSITKENDPYVQLYKKVVIEETNKQVAFIEYPGANDGRYLTRQGIPIIVSRPRGGGQHRDDEWVDIASMADFHRIYSRFIIEAQKS